VVQYHMCNVHYLRHLWEILKSSMITIAKKQKKLSKRTSFGDCRVYGICAIYCGQKGKENWDYYMTAFETKLVKKSSPFHWLTVDALKTDCTRHSWFSPMRLLSKTRFTCCHSAEVNCYLNRSQSFRCRTWQKRRVKRRIISASFVLSC